MPQGKVKWFSSEKAYGFIAQDDDDDIFVHVTGLAEGVTTLEPEQLVEFEVVQGRKGQQAANVKPVSRSAASAETTPASESEAVDESAEGEPVGESEESDAADESEESDAVDESDESDAVDESDESEESDEERDV